MSAVASIPQTPTADTITLIVSLEEPEELWVLPRPECGITTLPRVRHLLPDDFRDAAVVGFQPVVGTQGGWILRKAA